MTKTASSECTPVPQHAEWRTLNQISGLFFVCLRVCLESNFHNRGALKSENVSLTLIRMRFFLL